MTRPLEKLQDGYSWIIVPCIQVEVCRVYVLVERADLVEGSLRFEGEPPEADRVAS